jgi:hypothetical protein
MLLSIWFSSLSDDSSESEKSDPPSSPNPKIVGVSKPYLQRERERERERERGGLGVRQ